MSRPLKIWNGRGHGDWYRGHFYVAATTKKDAATMLAQVSHPAVVGRADFDFLINRMLREFTDYFSEGCWGTSMDGVVPERGVWASKGDHDKPVKIL